MEYSFTVDRPSFSIVSKRLVFVVSSSRSRVKPGIVTSRRDHDRDPVSNHFDLHALETRKLIVDVTYHFHVINSDIRVPSAPSDTFRYTLENRPFKRGFYNKDAY